VSSLATRAVLLADRDRDNKDSIDRGKTYSDAAVATPMGDVARAALLSANTARAKPATDLHDSIKCCFFCTQIIEEHTKYLQALRNLQILSLAASKL
jgi:hypothetical protein